MVDWWYASSTGGREGPVSEGKLLELRGAGVVTLDTLVWCLGMQQWQPYDKVPELLKAPAVAGITDTAKFPSERPAEPALGASSPTPAPPPSTKSGAEGNGEVPAVVLIFGAVAIFAIVLFSLALNKPSTNPVASTPQPAPAVAEAHPPAAPAPRPSSTDTETAAKAAVLGAPAAPSFATWANPLTGQKTPLDAEWNASTTKAGDGTDIYLFEHARSDLLVIFASQSVPEDLTIAEYGSGWVENVKPTLQLSRYGSSSNLAGHHGWVTQGTWHASATSVTQASAAVVRSGRAMWRFILIGEKQGSPAASHIRDALLSTISRG